MLNRLALAACSALALLCATPARADEPVPPAAAALAPVSKVVAELDRRTEALWKDQKLKPAKELEPAAFLRRLSLDVTGVIPREAVARALATRRVKKAWREELIEAVLHGEGYARFMAVRWGNLLVGRSALLQGGERAPLLTWLEAQLAGNTRWDVVVRALLDARGNPQQNGAAAYLLHYRDRPAEMAGNAMRVFQAQQVQCGQCHDHPYKPQWKQQDFWGVAAFFARAGVKRTMDMDELVEREDGQVRLPGPPGQPGPVVSPRFITGESIDPGEGDHRRAELGRILTSKNNPYFVRATVNRVWSFFLGAGFTDVNDLAKPVFEPLLELLEEDFRQSGYDLRRLVKVIVSSAAYGLDSGGAKKDKEPQLQVLARARLRPLTLEQIWWSTLEATGLDERFAAQGDEEKRKEARQNLKRRFFSVFLNDEDAPLEEYTITQALMLLNGPTTNQALWLQPENPVFKRILALDDPDAQVDALYLRVLGRPAAKAERAALRRFMGGSGARVAFLQDLWWALLNSSEFLFNH
ncbi:MAG: DUF1553 domain-containing protein [Planctomycetota bacterium]